MGIRLLRRKMMKSRGDSKDGRETRWMKMRMQRASLRKTDYRGDESVDAGGEGCERVRAVCGGP